MRQGVPALFVTAAGQVWAKLVPGHLPLIKVGQMVYRRLSSGHDTLGFYEEVPPVPASTPDDHSHNEST